jgi:RNA polymerase sigma factor (sigma-70 family)
MTDDEQLLRQYTQERSESAFSELVGRYIDLVYSVALRVANGDAHLAQDVTQTVFIDFARKAPSLPRGVVLAGWLHRHTCYTSATALRTERRRRIREQTAMELRALDDNAAPPWELLAPHLDAGLNQLSPADRDVLVLRFLRQQDFRAVGVTLNISEDAAQKRVSRALEKLRAVLRRRGLALAGAALVSALTSETLTAAPAGLAAGVTATALAANAQTGTTLSLLKLMAATKLKTGIIATVILASILTPLVLQHRAGTALRNLDEAMQQKSDQMAGLRNENVCLSNLLVNTSITSTLSEEQRHELIKLRGEIGRLRTETQRLAKIAAFRNELAGLPVEKLWPARANWLKQWLQEHLSEKIPEIDVLSDRTWFNSIYPRSVETDEECRRAMSVVRANAEGPTRNNLAAALHQYAAGNGGQFPADLSQLTPYLNPPLANEILARFTIVPANSLVTELQPGGTWAITQKAPVNEADDNRWALGLDSSRTANQQVTNRWVLLQ